ncbi:GNAT family N-acetyltransferase [Nannocystis bainbridge]|uniref:GNAT family N-acetyltransferase n=1 Tax=Nannocystis bainbridge TaxID=2995303 RepID=A0ABT5DYQ5_9BACT|nr:GNAT family N-acetyltransferase [Nannocystis bainbridge]MDC0718725.1 GNAT family N-acetyltransferase [Nannocystis bainbridge]
MLAGFTRDELLHEALVSPRLARGGFADIQVYERPDWFQILTPSFRRGGFNEVAFARLGDHEVEAVIDATLAQYEAQGLRFRWTVTPDCRPLDLADRLARRGLRRDSCIVMAAAIDALKIPEADDILVERVGPHNVELHAEVTGRGWNTDPAPLLAYQRSVLADPTDDRNHFFLASRGGEPVGIGNYSALARSAFLIGAVILEGHRSRGAYRSLLAARVRHAAARGLKLVTTHARADTSAPILARLGFVPIAELPVFFNR